MRRTLNMASRFACVLVCLSLSVVISACSPASPVAGQDLTPTTTPPFIPTATFVPTATSTGTTAITDPCVASDPSIASILSAQHIPLPSDTGVVDRGSGASDGVDHSSQFSDVGGCARNSSPDQVRSFYTAQMPAAGWTASVSTQFPCGGSPCWTRSDSPNVTLGVTLQKLQATSKGTTFTLHIVSYS